MQIDASMEPRHNAIEDSLFDTHVSHHAGRQKITGVEVIWPVKTKTNNETLKSMHPEKRMGGGGGGDGGDGMCV